MADEIPHIYYSKEIVDGLRATKQTIEIRGKDLEDCRKHFDEILGSENDE